jgi:hypothetical protein
MRYSDTRREIDKIRKILNETCGLNYLSVKDANFMIDKICEALAVDEKSNDWIPVSERLPEDDTTVLVSCKTRRGTTFVRAGYCIYGSWHLNCEGVTAWRPLPEPYKED